MNEVEFSNHLKNLADDFEESGYETTARDFRESAGRILELAEAKDLLESVLPIIEQEYDADYGGEETGYIPNDAMRIGTAIESLLGIGGL